MLELFSSQIRGRIVSGKTVLNKLRRVRELSLREVGCIASAALGTFVGPYLVVGAVMCLMIAVDASAGLCAEGACEWDSVLGLARETFLVTGITLGLMATIVAYTKLCKVIDKKLEERS